MLVILSPAKTMDMDGRAGLGASTKPLFEKEAEELAGKMREYSIEELEKLLKISRSLAEENYQRYQQFDAPNNPTRQAIWAYHGSVFKSIDVTTFSSEDFHYAQEHLRIISTMYGIVRPLDEIKAYRLAYSLKLKGMGGKNLYEYWHSKLTSPLIQDIQKVGGILVNLASLDILAALDMNQIAHATTMITPEFQEEREGKYETIRTYAKLARGAMTRYILLNRIQAPEKLIHFEWEGFRFNDKLSDAGKYIFTRKKRK